MRTDSPTILLAEMSNSDLQGYRNGLGQMALIAYEEPISPEAICFDDSELKSAEVLCVMVHSRVTEKVMEAMPQLRLIAARSTGFDHIDCAAAAKRGIAVCNVPEYGTDTVAEYTFALILNLTRHVHRAYFKTLTGGFSLIGLIGTDVAGKTLGILGLGKIGQKVAKIASGFDMHVVASDPVADAKAAAGLGVKVIPLQELFESADILAICCPLNAATHHLVDDSAFAAMRYGVLVVNTARGPIVETGALLKALHSGKVAGAALDVLEDEGGLSEEGAFAAIQHPSHEHVQTLAENLSLIRHPNVIATPHMAYFTKEAVARIHATTAENIRSFLAGQPTNLVASA